MKEPDDLTKEQLIKDLTVLRSRITELERSEQDKKKHQEELTRARAMYEGLFEFAPDAILVVGPDGEIVRVNKQAEKLFGYSRDELINLHLENLLPERFREIHREHRGKYMAEPHVRPMGTGLELYGRRKDGSEFSADIALGPLKVGDDILVMAVIRDISAQNGGKRSAEDPDAAVRGRKAVAFRRMGMGHRRKRVDLLRGWLEIHGTRKRTCPGGTASDCPPRRPCGRRAGP